VYFLPTILYPGSAYARKLGNTEGQKAFI